MFGDNVSDKELLEDIKSTEEELEAYGKLAQGYLTLSYLPENQGTQSKVFYLEYEKFFDKFNKCFEFLQELKKLKNSRNL
jgi:aryl-alcohol dehydrogenase-like predicted oxidoreductase